MRDLEAAGRAVVDEPALAPTAVALIEQRGRRRRRGRQARVAVALSCAVAVGGALALAAVRHTPTKLVAVGPHDQPVATDPQLRAHLGVDAPTGWVPVDYGDARIFVPSSWRVLAGGCPGTAPGWVEVGGPYKETCTAKVSSYIGISALDRTPTTRVARTIHGYALYAPDARTTDTFDIPALHVTLRADGDDAERVLETLAPSSKRVALTYRGPVPDGWQQISFAGVTLRVPAGWPRETANGCFAGPSGPMTLGPAPPGLWSCPEGSALQAPQVTGPFHDAVWITNARTWSGRGPINASGRPITVESDPAVQLVGDNRWTLQLFIRLNERYAVPVTIGLGRDGRIAAAIFRSIRIDTSVSTTTTTQPANVAANIVGKWLPVSIAGYDGPLTDPPLAWVPALVFANPDHWSGSDGCNDLSGAMHLGGDGSFATKGPILQTLVGCTLIVPTRRVVTTATHVTIAGDTLTFLDGKDKVLATYERAKSSTTPTTTTPTTTTSHA